MSSLADRNLWLLAQEPGDAANSPSESKTTPDPKSNSLTPGSLPRQPLEQETAAEALILIALAMHHWEGALTEAEGPLVAAGLGNTFRRLRLGRDEIRDVLKSAGITLEYPLGSSFAEVLECVEVRGWREQADLTAETVIQVLAPIIRQEGAICRLGQVVMGTPIPTPAAGQTTDIPDAGGQGASSAETRPPQAFP